MSKRVGEYALFSFTAAIFLGLAFAAGYLSRDWLPPSRLLSGTGPFPLLGEARDIVKGHFLGDLPDDTRLEYGMIRGMLSTLDDPYTSFVEPPQAELQNDNLHGEYGGIGVSLNPDETGAIRLMPFPDSPADRAGVVDGDALASVDGRPVAGIAVEEVSALIRGPVGEPVTLGVLRGDESLEFIITREIIDLPSVTWRIDEGHPSVGILVVSRFSEKTASELERGIEDLSARGATSLVLDLRDNGGGLLDAGVASAAIFLDGGVVMLEERRSEPEKTYRAPSDGTASGFPMVVLVNHGTASAAEIVAGALQDRGRGPLIGSPTYGKGSVQLVFGLSDGSSLHVTSARWFTPDRNPIDGHGITPDVEVEPIEGVDSALARAFEILEAGE